MTPDWTTYRVKPSSGAITLPSSRSATIPRRSSAGSIPMPSRPRCRRGWLAPEITFGDLPDGHEVIVDNQVVGAGGLVATLQVGNNEISVSARSMLPAMAIAGSVTQVDINGMTGWMLLSGDSNTDVSWQVDGSTYVYLNVHDDLTAEESLALARSVTFVPAGQWITLYDVPLPAFPPSPTTNPAT